MKEGRPDRAALSREVIGALFPGDGD